MCIYIAKGIAEFYGLFLERNFVENGWTLGQYNGGHTKVLTFDQVHDKAYVTALCMEWAQ